MNPRSDKQITRRRFLELMTAAGAVAAIDWSGMDALAKTISPQNRFPVVVIGAGLGGLVAAAYLSKQGFPVTLIEQHDRPGGYATAFERAGGKYRFEVSLHATVAENAMPQKILSELGIWEKIEVVDTNEFCRMVYPEFDVHLPAADPEGLVAKLAALFPGEKTGLKGFMDDMVRVRAEMQGRIGRESVMERLENITLADWLSHHIGNPQLKEVMSALWGYFGLPPSKINGLYYAIAAGEYLLAGGQYFKSRSQDLSDALAEAVETRSGQILFDTAVTGISVKNGRVSGVVDHQGNHYPARAVIANANIPDVINRLLDPAVPVSDWKRHLNNLAPSVSTCMVWLGLKRRISHQIGGYEIFVGEPSDAHDAYRRILNGDFGRVGLGVTLYDNLFEGYSTPGTNILSIMCLCGFEPWRKYAADYAAGRKNDYNRVKKQMAEIFIKRIEERLIPGLSGMIEVMESATPLTNWRYTGNPGGAIYGFARPKDQLTPLPVRTSVAGLYLAGAWTHGGGYTPAMMAGRKAAEALMKDCRKAG